MMWLEDDLVYSDPYMQGSIGDLRFCDEPAPLLFDLHGNPIASPEPEPEPIGFVLR